MTSIITTILPDLCCPQTNVERWRTRQPNGSIEHERIDSDRSDASKIASFMTSTLAQHR